MSSEFDQPSLPNAERSALLTIDVQRDFSLPSSPSHVPGTLEAASRMKIVVDAFHAASRPIVHVVRLYLPDGSNAELSRRPYLAAGNELVCPGTPGSELVDELKADPGLLVDADLLLRGEFQHVGPAEWIMYKPRWGAFYLTRLEEHLRGLGVDTLAIVGCNFPNCPRTTIYEASERDFRLVFVRDATSGVYQRGLDELAQIGAAVWDAEECATWLKEVATAAG